MIIEAARLLSSLLHEMKLSEPIVIAQDKLLRYLLLLREENDKSKCLASAGYTWPTGRCWNGICINWLKPTRSRT
jgi:hypothetical protein